MFKSFMKLIIGIAHVEVVVNFVEGIINPPPDKRFSYPGKRFAYPEKRFAYRSIR